MGNPAAGGFSEHHPGPESMTFIPFGDWRASLIVPETTANSAFGRSPEEYDLLRTMALSTLAFG
jgi:hypothetical protein